MVTERTLIKDQPLIFTTAPPDISAPQHSRFRIPRNLPYRDAPAFKASIYYWWWAFLKRNTLYQKTCRQFGQGKLSALYDDFGNIFETDFLSWWKSHKYLFAEKTALIEQIKAPLEDTALLYQIDPHRPLSQIQEEIKALHMQAHNTMPPMLLKQTSTAKYPIYTNVSAHTLHKVLAVWDLRCTHPKASAYELATLAGFKANIFAPPKYGEKRTRAAIIAEAHNRRAQMSIANKANRYLRLAAQYIEHVGHGEFPKAQRR